MAIGTKECPLRMVIVGGGISGRAAVVNEWNVGSLLRDATPLRDEAFRVLDNNSQLNFETRFDTSVYGADRIVYTRQGPHKALREAALSEKLSGPPAALITSSRVSSCGCETGIVTTEDGSTFQGDNIVGADGIHSALRAEVTADKIDYEVRPEPTGLSAYRLLVPISQLKDISVKPDVFDPCRSVTTMIVGHNKRIVMGPGSGAEILGLTCLVPDEQLNENSKGNGWTTPGSLDKLNESFNDFPPWLREIFQYAPDISLWQLRDIESLPSWSRGRVILIGDAAHAMLPTMGQGASQSMEDAEALAAFLGDLTGNASKREIEQRLNRLSATRHARASLIQAYSRHAAKPGTAKDSGKITYNPAEFLDYNYRYEGALDWERRNGLQDSAVQV